MLRTIFIAALLLAPRVVAQTTPSIIFGPIRTPEIQLGSGLTPTIVTNPPIVQVPGTELTGQPYEPLVSNAPPASTALLATRHFEYIVSPINGVVYDPHGSMADTSISLGEYARRLRAQKRQQSLPDSSGSPVVPR